MKIQDVKKGIKKCMKKEVKAEELKKKKKS